MQDVKELFNRRAAGWDKAHPLDLDRIRLITELCRIAPQSNILDVGCGTGALEQVLLRYDPAYLLAVDFAAAMIEVAKSKLSDPRVEFRCTDIFELRGVLFDYCFLYNVFPHIGEPKRLLAHLAGLLRPAGRLIISHTTGASVDSGTFLFGGEYPNRELVRLLRPYFLVDATVNSDSMVIVSGLRR